MLRLKTIFMFFGIGGAAAAAYVVVSSVLIALGWTPWIASVVSYGAFIPMVFLMHRKFTFGSEAQIVGSFGRYAIVQGIGLVLSAAIPRLLVDALPPQAALVAVVVSVAVVSYVLSRVWVF